MKKQFVLLMLLALATVQMRADIVIRCNEAGSSLDEKQIYIEGVCYEFHSAGDWYLEYLGGIPTTLNISGGYFEVVGHDESLPSEVNLREKFEPYKGDGKFFTAFFEKRTGDGQIQKTPLNIKFNNLNSDFSSDFFFPVTSIGNYAFYLCDGLASLTIPNFVTTIGYGAFMYCSRLTSVTIPNSVTTIGGGAFSGCSGLSSVHITDLEAWCKIAFIDWDSNPLGYARADLFLNGEEIKDLVIPSSVTSIGNYAFYGCYGLTSVTIPESVTSIGRYAFSGCSGLTSVTIPESVTSIGDAAFSWCEGLTSMIVESGNSVYDSRDNCSAIIETASNTLIAGCMNTVIPNSVTSIGEFVFYGCSGLTSVTIPESVTSIGNYAFDGCYGLTSVTIPESVTSIGNYAFRRCSSLTSIEIPNRVTSIGEFVFHYCSSLTSVTIPESVTSIGNGAFQDCSSLTSVTIPESVTSIGRYAFSGCSGLTSVTIPESVTSIGDAAFSWCEGLTSMIVESGNSVYDSRDNCSAIIETASNTLIAGCMNTIIPNSVTTIGERAFLGCYGLTSVTIPESVTSIGNYAFSNCYGLTSVTIPESVTSIGNYAFQGCYGLTSVTIPESVTSIGDAAFCWCRGLTEVTSLIEEPFEIKPSVFRDINSSATLYVPAGCKEKYEATAGWNNFAIIVEMGMEPVEEGLTIDIGNVIDENTNLEGTVVDNVFVNISNGDGGFDPVEKCIIVNKPTDDSAIDGKDIFGEDFKDNYTGIVFKVNEGKGSIKVEAQTQGNMVLKVKIGNSEPIEMELDGKQKVSFPYNVSEPSYVYIYGGMGAAGAKATGGSRAKSDADLLKIYGFEVVCDQTGIEKVDNEESTMSDAPIYNLNGQRINNPSPGIYIVNGRKVIVK